jgi:RNA-directed DNA polymerase
MRAMMSKLKLTVNERKTRLCRLPEETFDFLGYTIGRCYSRRTGRAYLTPKPSAKKVQRLLLDIGASTERQSIWLDEEEMIGLLNRKLLGWANYFRLGPVSEVYARVNRHVCHRLRRWLCRKHQVSGRGYGPYPDRVLQQEMGLLNLLGLPRTLLWA